MAAVLMLAAGCGAKGPTMAPAGGKVTYNGEPLANANVIFVPEGGGLTSVGQTNAEGRFTLSSSTRPGAVVGKHQVAVQAIDESKTKTIESGEVSGARRSLIPEKYGNYAASELTAEVKKDGPNDFTLELSGPRKP
jgi:hypothetical protein